MMSMSLLQQCKSSDALFNASEHAESDVDDEDGDLTDARAAAAAGDGVDGGSGGGAGAVVDGREKADTKLDENPAGRDLLGQLHHPEHGEREREKQACDMGLMRRRKRPADQVTSSPSVDEDDNDDFVEYGMAGGSPLRHRTASEDAASSPSLTPRPPPSLEQTEIKIQRPLGLLAQHGITTKTSTAALQARTAHRADLDPPSKDRQHHPTLSAGLDFSQTPLSLMDRRFMPSPPAPSTPLGCLDPGKPTTTSPGAHHWTFEEQFKQVSV